MHIKPHNLTVYIYMFDKVQAAIYRMQIKMPPLSTSMMSRFLCKISKFPLYQIIHEHAGVGDVVGMEIGNFEVVSRFGRFELLQRYAFYFAERAVGKKDFIAAL